MKPTGGDSGLRSAAAAVLAAAALLGGCRSGETGSGGKQVVFDRFPASRPLTVSSPDIRSGQPIPDQFSDYGEKQTPRIAWPAPPAGTKSMVFLLEDPDAPSAQPFVHWVVYGISPTATGIGPTLPSGATAGTNSNGSPGYFGPRPPQGDPPHHYHFEAFALDTTPSLSADADRDAVAAAMQGHVVAKGELIATYQKP